MVTLCTCAPCTNWLDRGTGRGSHGHHTPKLTVKQRQEKLLEELALSGLESWSPNLVASACSLLAEYHDVFSLEPSELGCTHSTEHVIKVTDDTPFKEHI